MRPEHCAPGSRATVRRCSDAKGVYLALSSKIEEKPHGAHETKQMPFPRFGKSGLM
jgi:hypothetical protein